MTFSGCYLPLSLLFFIIKTIMIYYPFQIIHSSTTLHNAGGLDLLSAADRGLSLYSPLLSLVCLLWLPHVLWIQDNIGNRL